MTDNHRVFLLLSSLELSLSFSVRKLPSLEEESGGPNRFFDGPGEGDGTNKEPLQALCAAEVRSPTKKARIEAHIQQ